jgi:hypothetical protein
MQSRSERDHVPAARVKKIPGKKTKEEEDRGEEDELC